MRNKDPVEFIWREKRIELEVVADSADKTGVSRIGIASLRNSRERLAPTEPLSREISQTQVYKNSPIVYLFPTSNQNITKTKRNIIKNR